MAQPFLHELVSCVQAPTVAVSGLDGQVRTGGVQGVLRHDRRLLSELVVEVDGHEPVPVGHALTAAGEARFVGVLRAVEVEGADPRIRLERRRLARPDGVDEHVSLVNTATVTISVTVGVRVAVDLAAMNDVRHGETPAARIPVEVGPGTACWADDLNRVTVRADGGHAQRIGNPGGDPRFFEAAGDPRSFEAAGDPRSVEAGDPSASLPADGPAGSAVFSWRVTVPARHTWSASLRLDVIDLASESGGASRANVFLPGRREQLGWDNVTVVGPDTLTRLVDRSVDDLAALALADPLAPEDAFLAAGSPWFFTLFGRDSLWAARLTLPLGTDLARGTLRTLARRQGTRFDSDTAEAPGKILHEVRREPVDLGRHGSLPPVYFGTVDATALWICLLHDAWRWGMAPTDVAALLDPLEAALGWLTGPADGDGDGFLEYLDESGHGLANQGWKDSGDSIQFPDGRIAEPPIALSEAQAYAHEAALSGAALLEAFGRQGGDRLREWAKAMRERFRTAFWVFDARGRFPAIALDGSKAPVDTATSNLGHLLGTGLLDSTEAATVASRLAETDLDSGYGLHTMSADAAGFNPLGYHAGSIWPHDTAIAILGLAREGHLGPAASFARGLVRVAPDFGYRLPELFAGTDARAGDPVLAYPASCRPQAWSAAAAVAMLQAALGLTPDVPGGVLRVAPAEEFASWLPLRVTGLRVAGHPLTVAVDADGVVTVETTAPLTVEAG